MPQAPVPSVQLQFQGRRDFPPEQEIDDWGLTPTQQETYVEQFRRLLSSKNAWHEDRHDYYLLRRFLRARSYDLEKATAMWMHSLKCRADHQVDTILQDFTFQERDKFLCCYPQGYHKTDKMGRPVYIQLLGQVNVDQIRKVTTEERMVKFHIQEYERCVKVILPVCSHLAGRNIDQTFGIMDVRGVGLSAITGDVKRLLALFTKYDQDNYPEMLGHICVINAPGFFKLVWSMVKGWLDPRTQGKIEILGTDYIKGLLKHIDIESVPDWLGGRSHGSLLDDVGPWSDPDVIARLGLDVEQLRLGHRPNAGLVSAASARLRGTSFEAMPSFRDGTLQPIRRHSDLSDGYHSPSNSQQDLSMFRMQPNAAAALTSQASLERPPGGGYSSMGNMMSVTAAAGPGSGGFATIPEQAATSSAQSGSGRQGTLVQRIAALEEMLAPHKEQLQAVIASNGITAGNNVTNGGVSTKSAPAGSLLYRVEMLEEAMNVMLAAQQTLLLNQQRTQQDREEALKAEQQKMRTKKSRVCCCCTVM